MSNKSFKRGPELILRNIAAQIEQAVQNRPVSAHSNGGSPGKEWDHRYALSGFEDIVADLLTSVQLVG